ncbi:hypothetical protein D3C75_1043360 [compost metagenome]
MIGESGAGLTCASGDAKGLADITLSLAKADASQLTAMGESGRRYYLNNYSKSFLLARLEELFRNATLRKASH